MKLTAEKNQYQAAAPLVPSPHLGGKNFLTLADKPDMEISSIGLSAMQNAQDRFERAAAQVARAPADPQDSVDLSAQAVQMISAKNQYATGVKIVHLGDEMQQSLLNLLA